MSSAEECRTALQKLSGPAWSELSPAEAGAVVFRETGRSA